MCTARGNVRYDVLLPLCDILIFMGATRILSFRSTPKTASGLFDESPSHGMRCKNLVVVLASARKVLGRGDVGVVPSGVVCSSSR